MLEPKPNLKNEEITEIKKSINRINLEKMKKSILIVISLIAVFFFAGTTQVSAQWSFIANWNDTYCSCGDIVSKDLRWEITKISDNSVFASGNLDITSLSPPQTISGPETPIVDERYKICIKVSYYDGSIDPCCQGEKCESTDSAILLAGTQIVTAIMNWVTNLVWW